MRFYALMACLLVGCSQPDYYAGYAKEFGSGPDPDPFTGTAYPLKHLHESAMENAAACDAIVRKLERGETLTNQALYNFARRERIVWRTYAANLDGRERR